MTATVIRRINAGMYAHIKTVPITNVDVASAILEVKDEVLKTKNQHCLVIESKDNIQCFYIETDLTIIESNQKPTGGVWFKQKT